MAHLQYMPGDPRLVDQLVYELKSKGIFDQFRKDCISDVDTRPAYQNLRQRVESSVALFLARQPWQPDLNKNQLREKLRKHILDGNYLEQGVERIVDQVVNPKVASVFIPQVEDLVYNYLGIARKKSAPETSTDKGNSSTDLLPNDLEAVSPGSVKSNDDKDEPMEETKEEGMDIDAAEKIQDVNDITMPSEAEDKEGDTQLSGISDLTSHDSEVSLGKLSIPMPADDINLENIPSPENSPPKIDLDSIELPKEEPIELKDIPLPEDSPKDEKEQYFKPVNSEDDSSSDSSIIRNMSPLTPIRNYNNENSCDAQQAFENESDIKTEDNKEPNTFRFAIEAKSSENSSDNIKEPKADKEEPTDLAYQFNEQVNINTFNTPMFDDSSNSHNLQIDYESDVNSKTNLDKIPFPDDPNSEDSKKESTEEKKSHKSSRSRDSHRHSSSSKDRRSDSKHSVSRDRKDSRHDKKSSKDDQSKSKSSSDKSKDRTDRKDNKDTKHKSSSSSSKDSKHRSSSSSQRHSSSSKHDDKKSSSSSNNKDKEKTDKNSKEHRSSKDSKSRSDKDKKNKKDDKDKDKKDKKDDDHYSASGRGNVNRRSTDRDSNDGSSSSKGSQHQPSSKSSESKTNKGSSSKSDNTSPSSNCTTPSEKDVVPEQGSQANLSQYKPIVRVDTHLETPRTTPPRLPFVPDVTLKKPRFAANLEEAKRLMKMRKFLDEEQKRMNQEAALLLEFQANVRPSLSQVYSSIPGPELEFACISNIVEPAKPIIETNYAEVQQIEEIPVPDSIEMELTEMNKESKEIVQTETAVAEIYEPLEYKANFEDSEKILNEISKKVYGVVDDGIDDNTEEIKELELKPTDEVIMEGIRNEQNEFEVMLGNEDIKEKETIQERVLIKNEGKQPIVRIEERPLEYFAEHEKYDAELERIKFECFLKEYLTITVTDKLYLINCDSYEESIMKEVAETFGQFQIINYHQNGHKNKNIVKNVNVSNEIVLPLDRHTPIEDIKSPISSVFSPVKSECSFELTSDYDAKLEEMVNKTSRQEIMEIILGGGSPGESPIKMPQIDYFVEDNIREDDLKRKMSVESIESTDNNNGHVLTPCKMRKLSESDQITSTTEETPNENRTNFMRSKYLGRARRVGLPRPRRTVHPNSPSSDKSVENYDTNESGITPPNGKLKTQRKVQRYDTSDLYKPKLHYLSRRNNIS
ncbi:hypothetical protein MSG28_014019 [Choristoneura fumiferana]|uniref:Uncharacterized protein n=1 Tax=Choristoneura fumiferana TaxID=7141 RepID=A0ACC0JFN6_CHOFU|nr:hypothetical protein MSG28_014019 [Choristoneura fumiferana]